MRRESGGVEVPEKDDDDGDVVVRVRYPVCAQHLDQIETGTPFRVEDTGEVLLGDEATHY